MPFKTASGKLFYRVGDVIISTNSENPSKIYGGTWQLLCPGRTLVCIDMADADFNTVRKTGGEKKHTLTVGEMPVHNHSASSGINSVGHTHSFSATTSSSGAHVHGIGWTRGYNYNRSSYTPYAHDPDGTDGYKSSGCQSAGAHTHTISGTTGGVSANHTHAITIGNSGSGQAQNNLQPYMVVYMWLRVS